MDNTQLIILLAVGGLGFYVLSRREQEPKERIVLQERKLTRSEQIGGAIGTLGSAAKDALDELSFG